MTFRQIASPASLVLAAAGVAVTATGFALIPAGTLLPVHWGLDGQVDATMPRTAALLMPVGFVAAIWALFYLIGRFAPAKGAEAARHALRAALMAITGLFAAIAAGIVAIGVGVDVDMVRIVSLCMAVLFIVLGNILPKTQPNGFAGIRIPTTLNDPVNWQSTHRVTGLLMMAAGLALLVAAFVVPTGPWLIAAVVGSALVPVVVGTIYSLRLAASRRAPVRR